MCAEHFGDGRYTGNTFLSTLRVKVNRKTEKAADVETDSTPTTNAHKGWTNGTTVLHATL